MDTEELKQELKNKERSISDLVRHIKTRTDSNPNYSLFLGAGCSVSSGIASGQNLVNSWRKDVYYSDVENEDVSYVKEDVVEYLTKNHGNWYNKLNEYSSLFEKKYDLPRQRRIFVEQEVRNKNPSLGYAYLTKLVDNEYFNTIFTTNFDDLVNEAFYQFSNKRPIVCAHDSSISSITVTSKRPKIIKLHGDYLFDDIKSTLRETESLEENMKNKFLEFSKDFGLITIGYGGEDRSVMDMLSYLLKHEDYYKNGIYWCIKKGSSISEELRKLLWKDRVFYVLCDGFDELLAEISHKVYGDSGFLPIETSVISNKSSDLIERFINNDYLNNSASRYIKADLKSLKKQNNKDSIFNFIKEMNIEKGALTTNDDYSDSELIMLLELEDLLDKNDFYKTIEKARGFLTDCKRDGFRIKILNILINLYEDNGKSDEAIKICDEIIDIDDRNIKYYIKKSHLLPTFHEKIGQIESAIKVNPYYYSLYNEKAYLFQKQYFSGRKVAYGPEYKTIISVLDEGVIKNPSINNDCWKSKFDFIRRATNAKGDSELREILAMLEKQDSFSPVVLKMKLHFLKDDSETIDIGEYLDLVDSGKDSVIKKHRWIFVLLRLEAMSKFNMLDELESELIRVYSDSLYKNNHKLLYRISVIKLRKLDDIDSSIEFMKKAIDIKIVDRYLIGLAQMYVYKGMFEEAGQLLDEHEKLLDREDFLKMWLDIHDKNNALDLALNFAKKLMNLTPWPEDYVSVYNYLLIKLGRFEEAMNNLKKILSEFNYSLEMESEIINFELCRKKMGKNVNKERLNNLLDYSSDLSTKAAAYALLNDNNNALDSIKGEIKEDQSFKYIGASWPVFASLSGVSEYKRLFH